MGTIEESEFINYLSATKLYIISTEPFILNPRTIMRFGDPGEVAIIPAFSSPEKLRIFAKNLTEKTGKDYYELSRHEVDIIELYKLNQNEIFELYLNIGNGALSIRLPSEYSSKLRCALIDLQYNFTEGIHINLEDYVMLR